MKTIKKKTIKKKTKSTKSKLHIMYDEIIKDVNNIKTFTDYKKYISYINTTYYVDDYTIIDVINYDNNNKKKISDKFIKLFEKYISIRSNVAEHYTIKTGNRIKSYEDNLIKSNSISSMRFYQKAILKKRWEEYEIYLINNVLNISSNFDLNINKFLYSYLHVAFGEKWYSEITNSKDTSLIAIKTYLDSTLIKSDAMSAANILQKLDPIYYSFFKNTEYIKNLIKVVSKNPKVYFGTIAFTPYYNKFKNVELEKNVLESKSSTFAYYYAFFVKKKQWKAGEKLIKKSSNYAYSYARNVLKQRWEDGEKSIFRSNKTTIDYIMNVVKKPLPEAEKIIAKKANSAFNYAFDILKGRFELGESEIAKTGTLALAYANEFLTDRFEIAEPNIIKSCRSSALVEYAIKHNMKDFKLAESKIAESSSASYKYATEVLKNTFPLGEPAIKRNSKLEKYYNDFISTLVNFDENGYF